jgi:hypothetical protein
MLLMGVCVCGCEGVAVTVQYVAAPGVRHVAGSRLSAAARPAAATCAAQQTARKASCLVPCLLLNPPLRQ